MLLITYSLALARIKGVHSLLHQNRWASTAGMGQIGLTSRQALGFTGKSMTPHNHSGSQVYANRQR